MAHELSPDHERLAALVGRWRTEGWTTETADASAARIEALDTYEWLPGRFGLLHTVDARVGDTHVEGAEIIGWEPARGAYVTRYFGSDGPNAYEASLADEGGVLVWTMRSEMDRFTGRFSDDRRTLTGHWERLDAEQHWRPWMEVTLTRLPD
jgi:Protein of unknown function (DUF1579)